MNRNQAYGFGAVLLAVTAAVVAGIAIAIPALAGCSVLLAVAAGAFAVLRVHSRIRSESRHRWTLQRRVGLLEEAMRGRTDLTEEKQHAEEGPDRDAALTNDEFPVGDASYLQMALLHDRLHALEASLRRTS